MIIVKQIKELREDKSFLRKVVAISVPIVLQQLLTNLLNLIDTLMIGRLGESTIAAVGLANKVFFVYTLLTFGISSGAAVLQSQFYGKNDIKNIQKVQGIALVLSLSAAVLFTAAAVAIPETVMRIFTNSEEAIRIGASYLRIVGWSYAPTAITAVYTSTLRSTNRVKAPVIITTVSILVNVTFNYILIFGKLGLPALGAPGAAIATVIARFVECSVMLLLVYLKKMPAGAKPGAMLSFDKSFCGTFFKTALPVILNEFMWGLGITMYSLVYGRMGDDAVAAITVTQSIEQVAQVVFMGLANATAIILGNELGAGKLKDAKRHSEGFILIQFAVTIVILIIFIFARMPIIYMFGLSGDVAQLSGMCFGVFMIYLPAKVFNLVNIVGILRSGGDTKAALFLDVMGVWAIGIPMAFLGGIILKQPIYIVYAMVLSEEIFKMVLGIIRYFQKKWLKNIVEKA